jgi:hypothetical protein
MSSNAYVQDKLSHDLDLPMNAAMTKDGFLDVYLLPNSDSRQASHRFYVKGREPSAILHPVALPPDLVDPMLVSDFRRMSSNQH